MVYLVNEKQKHVESNDTQAKVQIMGTTEQANIKKNSPKNDTLNVELEKLFECLM